MTPSLTLQPIGYLRTRQQVKFQAGHQPVTSAEERNELELLPGCRYEEALRDIAGMERVWLLWWFHRNENWRPMVLPPRGVQQRRGVFATRSPHRPNPLGLTCVPLIHVKGRMLTLGPCDLLDGTPIFDIKPYVPAYDSFPQSSAGWIDAMEAELAAPAKFTVSFSELAQAQAQWLRDTWQIDFTSRLIELLSHDPRPHRTRRIRSKADGRFEIGCGAWRAWFTVEQDVVCVQALDAGYPKRFLEREGYEMIADRDAQMAYLARWPDAAGAS